MTTQASEPTPPSPETISFLTWLVVENGYRNVGLLPDGRWVAIREFAYTNAIVVGTVGNKATCGDRWCYHTYSQALSALDAWDGAGEPAGWHRHPYSGRRVGEDGVMYVSP